MRSYSGAICAIRIRGAPESEYLTWLSFVRFNAVLLIFDISNARETVPMHYACIVERVSRPADAGSMARPRICSLNKRAYVPSRLNSSE